jgi:hypothetical protein
MKRAISRGSSVSVVVVLLATVGGACEKSAQLEAMADADQAAWKRDTSSLKARASDLDQRLRALPAPAKDAPLASTAGRRRVEALVAGSRESLFDLDRSIDDGVREVKAAIGRNNNEGEERLTAVAETIDGYVRQQEQSVTAAEAAMTKIEEGR